MKRIIFGLMLAMMFCTLGRVGLGISAQTSHRTVRESLPSYGSSHPNGFNRLGLTPCCQW